MPLGCIPQKRFESIRVCVISHKLLFKQSATKHFLLRRKSPSRSKQWLVRVGDVYTLWGVVLRESLDKTESIYFVENSCCLFGLCPYLLNLSLEFSMCCLECGVYNIRFQISSNRRKSVTCDLVESRADSWSEKSKCANFKYFTV